ncbi:hypothetical protein FOL47_009244, partial [Perkinsus chesapeaki]
MSRGSLTGVRGHELVCKARQEEELSSIPQRFDEEELKQCSLSTQQWTANGSVHLCKPYARLSPCHLGEQSVARRRIEAYPATTAVTLADVQDIGITINIWSRNSRSFFIVIVGHYYSESDFSLRRIPLDFIDLKDRHTGANIAENVSGSLEVLGCAEKVRSFTTDSASSNFRAMDILYEKLQAPFMNLGRAGHKLRLLCRELPGTLNTEPGGSVAEADSSTAAQCDLGDVIREDDSFIYEDSATESETSEDFDLEGDQDNSWADGVDTAANRSAKSVGKLLVKLRSHAQLLRQSNIAHQLLVDCINEEYNGQKRFKVIPRDVVLRWNSSVYLLTWFQQFRDGFSRFQRQALSHTSHLQDR